MRKRLRMRYAVPALLLAAGLAYLGWKVLKSPEGTPEGALVANGTIEATETDVSPKVAGRILRLTVEEGDEVAAGQVIATLDGGELTAQEAAKKAHDQAKARLNLLEAGTRPEQIERREHGRI